MFKIAQLIEATGGELLSGEKDAFVSGVSIDSRTIRGGDLFIAIKGSHLDGHDFVEEAIKKGARAVIVQNSPANAGKILTAHKRDPAKCVKNSKKISIILVKDTIKALGDIAGFNRRNFNLPVIGITGSNGKTTTKDMIAWILEKEFKVLKNLGTQNNQIGLPMALLKLNKYFDIAVLEMGTNHFGEIAYLTKIAKPNIGIINNIGPAHLEFFNTLEGVYREKYSLINNLTSPAIAILNMDDHFLRRNKTDKDKFVIGFGIKNNADYRALEIKRGKNHIEFLVNSRYKIQLKTLGVGNVYNALVAISVARLFGIDYNIIAKRLSIFKFLQGRLIFKNCDNINFIDDTYNANPASLEEAMDVLDNLKIRGRKIFIMGDMLELGRHKENLHRLAGERIARVCDVLITVGNLTRLTSKQAFKSGLDIKSIFNCGSPEEAKALLFKRINPNKNDIVLVKGSRLMQMEKVFKSR